MTLPERFDEFIRTKYPNLKFRSQQREVILDIIDCFYEGKTDFYLLDAPTGSGKSIIAILFADFVSSEGKTGYMLASDLSLHSQYVTDFRRLGLPWGDIKGVDNYICDVNGEKFSVGECKMRGLSSEEAKALPCYGSCGYYSNRAISLASPVCLMTYPYALIQRNYVEDKFREMGQVAPFAKRDFVICDEAHKVMEIVQNHFSPVINENVYKNAKKVRDFLAKNKFKAPEGRISDLKRDVDAIVDETNPNALQSRLSRIQQNLSSILKLADPVKKRIRARYSENERVPKDWKMIMSQLDYIKDVDCKIEDYNIILDQTGLESMIKNPQENATVFNCIDERYLMYKHFNSRFGFKLMMTATMGKPEDYMRGLAAKSVRYFKMHSTFDYSKSPIIYYPGHRMSMKTKDQNMPWVIETVADILKSNPKYPGIIHSGSYDLANKIYAGLPKEQQARVLIYRGTEEKNQVLAKFSRLKNMVIMGPSLLEGLNLIDDLSRFQIFVKVPYPSLGDKYVEAKLKFSQKWYNWKTALAILQGVGRSIRTPEDWAVTHILDGCFSDILRNSPDQFPEEFMQRIQLNRTETAVVS